MFTVTARETYGMRSAPCSSKTAAQLDHVDVALERALVERVVRLVDDDVDEAPAGELLVQPGGREVHVAGDHVAGLDEHLADDVLGAAALVRGHHERVAVDVLHRLLEVEEVLAARVRLVAEHEPGPLLGRHRVGAAVGEQVDEDVAAAQLEGVPPRLGQRRLALGPRGPADVLDGLDLVRLGPRVAADGCGLSHVLLLLVTVSDPRAGAGRRLWLRSRHADGRRGPGRPDGAGGPRRRLPVAGRGRLASGDDGDDARRGRGRR